VEGREGRKVLGRAEETERSPAGDEKRCEGWAQNTRERRKSKLQEKRRTTALSPLEGAEHCGE